jgi:hypothetical protein
MKLNNLKPAAGSTHSISQVVEVEDTPSNRGMIRKVHHLVSVVD